MKKTALLILILTVLLTHMDFSIHTIYAKENIEIEMPESLDLKKESVSFAIELKSTLAENEKVKVSYDSDCSLISDTDTIPLTIQLSRTILDNSNRTIEVTITHEPVSGNFSLDFVMNFTVITEKTEIKKEVKTVEEKTKEDPVQVTEDEVVCEKKTLYGIKRVKEWNYSGYSLDKPSGPSLLVTQYGSETAEFGSDFSLSIPENGIYKEVTQYGKKTRTKKETETTELVSHSYHYNNIGACPADCIPETIHNYGEGCECTIQNYETVTKKSYVYGKWKTDESSFRFDEPYKESDTVEPVSRIVYLKPISFYFNDDWSFEEKTGDSKTRILTRNVFLSPASYEEPDGWSETKPEAGDEGIIVTKEKCRLVVNGAPQAWKDC